VAGWSLAVVLFFVGGDIMPVSYMEVNLSALRHNLRVIRQHLPKEVECLAVVKANAYGHGAVEELRLALEEGYTSAAVARVEEGQELRDAGFTCPIYVLGLPLPEDMPIGVNKDLILPIDDTVDLDSLECIAAVSKKVVDVMLPIDTGMNRIGTHPEDVPALLEKLKKYPHIHIKGTFTHMATADHKEKDAALKQLDRFDEAISHMPVDKDFVISSANSAGVIDIPRSWHTLARPGIILYGPQPSDVMTNKLDLQYAMRIISHVTHVQTLHKGEAIGYGGTYVAEKDMKTATIPIGYADGYPRCLSNKGAVLINGKRCPIVGRICMDQFMVACGNDVEPGDEVVLMGRQGKEEISLDEVAVTAGTIPHEITCDLKRIPRLFVDIDYDKNC